MKGLFQPVLLLLCLSGAPSLALQSRSATTKDRRHFLASLVSAGSIASSSASTLVHSPTPALADDDEKLALSDDELKEVVKEDLLKRQFLVTGNLTPSIYKSAATFTDEIDTYQMDQWMKGTQKLFVGEKSDVRLVGDISVSPEKVRD